MLNKRLFCKELRLATIVVMLCAAGVVAHSAQGQAPAEAKPAPKTDATPTVEEVTREGIQKRLDVLKDSQEPTDVEVVKLLGEALEELDRAEQAAAQTAQWEAMLRSAPEELRQVKEELEKLPSAPTVQAPPGATVEDLAHILRQKTDAVAAAKGALADLEAKTAQRASRLTEIPDSINKLTEEREEIARQLAAPPDPNAPASLTAARGTLLAAKLKALDEQIASLQKELAAYQDRARIELPESKRRLATERVRLLEEEVTRWRELLDQQRQIEASREAERAKAEAERVEGILKPLADDYVELANEGEKLAGSIPEATHKLEEANAFLDTLQKQFTRTKERVDKIGLTNNIGLLLRNQRAELRDVGKRYRSIRERQEKILTVQERLLELRDREMELGTVERQVQSELADLGLEPGQPDYDSLEPKVRDLVKKRADVLASLQRDYKSYLQTLFNLDATETQIIEETEAYADYIDERVLWIRSADFISPSTLKDALDLLGGLGRPQVWTDVVQTLAKDAALTPVLAGLAILVFAPLFLGRPWLHGRLKQAGKAAEIPTQTRLGPTLAAAVWTALLAAPLPLLLAYVGWRLNAPLDSPALVKAIGVGMMAAAAFFLPLEAFRQVCRPSGLAAAHFPWPKGSLVVLRRNLRWYVALSVPVIFVEATVQAQGTPDWENSLGRMCFVVATLLSALVFHRVLRPGGSFYRHLLAEQMGGGFYRFRHVWYAAGMLALAVFLILAATGFYYTASQLGIQLRDTFFLLLGLTVVDSILTRWILLLRRRLSIERARQRRAAAAQAEGKASTELAESLGLLDAAESEPDLAVLSEQLRRLAGMVMLVAAILGVWLIWVDVFPALTILDKIPLWPPTEEGLLPLTLADVAMAVAIAAMTWIAARNIPGLLEFALPPQLELDAGARFAITTLTRYVIVTVGVLFACGALGITWGKAQWLIAALGVGLGFGLQEIFANFISGLILLFERPIRVGDIVTIDDVTGIVSRIRIRATTITNWDRKELIVPNKEFITGRLLNWTLTNPVNRVVIEVGVAYGSDTDRARELLLQVAGDHPLILEDPAPMATFEGFGDSTLNFVLRCYLPNLDDRLRVIHELHSAIHRIFAEAGIEIAFPQRDIHVRSVVDPVADAEPTPPGTPAETPAATEQSPPMTEDDDA